jgi:hypothetical protein
MTKNGKLADFMEAYRLLGKHGHYDVSIAGAIAEAYAEEVLGMEKAPAGTAGFDGFLNGRKLQVKGKSPRTTYALNRHYAAIRHENDGLADDLFVLMITPETNELIEFGPVPIEGLRGYSNQTQKRYYLHHIQQAMEQ